MTEFVTLGECPRPAEMMIEAYRPDGGRANGPLAASVAACLVCAERLVATHLDGLTVYTTALGSPRPCGRTCLFEDILAEGADEPDPIDAPPQTGGFAIEPTPGMDAERDPDGPPVHYSVYATSGRDPVGYIVASDDNRWLPISAIGGNERIGPLCPRFGDAVAWVTAQATVVIDPPPSPMDALEHGFKRHGEAWSAGYDEYLS